MQEDIIDFIVENDKNQRIDVLLQYRFPQFTRSLLKKWIDQQLVTVNDSIVKPSYHVRLNDRITIHVPPARPLCICAQPIELSVIYEDKDIIVVNKPAGLVVHPAPGHTENTLVNALLYHCKNLSGINGILRPGIVHRLDKNTSGVIISAKNDMAHQHLSSQFADRTVKKTYIGIVAGIISPGLKKEINLPIGRHKIQRKKMAVNMDHGKEAVTQFAILRQLKRCALLKITIKTGRTHQIRVHLAHLGHPIIGDTQYGFRNTNNEFMAQRQMLHAFSLAIIHPTTKQPMIFKAKLPDDMKNLIKTEGGNS